MARRSVVMAVSLPPDLYHRALRVAREESRSKSELVREALRVYLGRQRGSERQPPARSPSEEDREVAAVRAYLEGELGMGRTR